LIFRARPAAALSPGISLRSLKPAVFFSFSFAVLILSSLSIPSAFARTASAGENPAQQPQAQAPLRVSSELVKINASIADANGNYVGGLGQKDFRVLVDGVESPILFFTPTEEPARILVLVETSPAVYLIQNDHLAAAYALLEGLSPQDEVALFTYDSAAHGILSFTSDKTALAESLARIQYVLGSGQLNFYASLAEVLDWLSSLQGKKAAVLLTTGLDSSDPSFWDSLARKLRATDVVIYPVALGGSFRNYKGKKKSRKKKNAADNSGEPAPSNPDNPLSFAKANTALQNIASATGGRAYFPASAADFVPDYREIASALRHEYLLGIAPLHDGKFHVISVELAQPAPMLEKKSKHAPPAFRIYARSGYQAPSQ